MTTTASTAENETVVTTELTTATATIAATASSSSSSSSGLSSEEWLLTVGGILIGIMLIIIVGCVVTRWYLSKERRQARMVERETQMRKKELKELEDEELPSILSHSGPPLPNEEAASDSAPPSARPDRSLQIMEGSPLARRRRGQEEEPISFRVLTDPLDTLEAIDESLYKSHFESDEEDAPLPHKREGSWMETDADRRQRYARRHRPGKGASRKRFDEYLKVNHDIITSQQKDMYLGEGGRTPRRNINRDSDSSTGDSSDTGPRPILPLSRVEAEQMRIDDLNAAMVRRRRLQERIQSAHPVYQFQDPIRASSKALLSTTRHRAAVEIDDTLVKEREQRLQEKIAITGNDVPWGAREDAAAADAVARLEDLPWMTSAQVKAIAKEHVRSERIQVKKMQQIEQYITEDGRIDYEANKAIPSNASIGRYDSRGVVSDRASSFRDGRASSIRDGRASALVRGSVAGRSFAGIESLGGSKAITLSRLDELNGNARNSALTADDLARAREVFGGSTDRQSSLGDKRSITDRASSARHANRREKESIISSEGASNSALAITSIEDRVDNDDEDEEDYIYTNRDLTIMSKQELVDARSLSVLRAQLADNKIAEEDEHGDHQGQPHHWYMAGDEQFFHVSPQPQRRLRQAAIVADAHHIEGQATYSNRIAQAEDRMYDAQMERRAKAISARRMAGLEVNDDDSDYSDISTGSQDVRVLAPVSVIEAPDGSRVMRAFASPHKDPYLNML